MAGTHCCGAIPFLVHAAGTWAASGQSPDTVSGLALLGAAFV
jgi:hypothetical protein